MCKKLNADLAFWTGFYGDEGDDDCFKWASDKAYLDMNRTMKFAEGTSGKSQQEQKAIADTRAGWRAEGTAIIQKAILTPTYDDFETWHKTVCNKLLAFYKEGNKLAKQFTYGQAQKWLNMTLKYLWLLYRQDRLPDKNACAFIKKHQDSFHVPLDSYILRYVARRPKDKKTAFPSNGNGLNDTNDKWETSLGQTWSKIDDPVAYADYQEKLKGAIADYASPLEWELVHWHKALMYYDPYKKEANT